MEKKLLKLGKVLFGRAYTLGVGSYFKPDPVFAAFEELRKEIEAYDQAQRLRRGRRR